MALHKNLVELVQSKVSGLKDVEEKQNTEFSKLEDGESEKVKLLARIKELDEKLRRKTREVEEEGAWNLFLQRNLRLKMEERKIVVVRAKKMNCGAIDFKPRHKHLSASIRCNPRHIPLEKQSNMPWLYETWGINIYLPQL